MEFLARIALVDHGAAGGCAVFELATVGLDVRREGDVEEMGGLLVCEVALHNGDGNGGVACRVVAHANEREFIGGRSGCKVMPKTRGAA